MFESIPDVIFDTKDPDTIKNKANVSSVVSDYFQFHTFWSCTTFSMYPLMEMYVGSRLKDNSFSARWNE